LTFEDVKRVKMAVTPYLNDHNIIVQ